MYPGRGDSKVDQGEEKVPAPFHRSHCPGNREAQHQACLGLLDLGTPQVQHCTGHRVMLCNWGLAGEGCCEETWRACGLEEGEGKCQTTPEALWTWSGLRPSSASTCPGPVPFYHCLPGAHMYIFFETPAPPVIIMPPDLFLSLFSVILERARERESPCTRMCGLGQGGRRGAEGEKES